MVWALRFIQHLGWSFFRKLHCQLFWGGSFLVQLSLQSPEQSCLQGSFTPDHNTVLALEASHCWLHWKEASSVLVSYSNVYPKNSWAEELLWKTSFRTLSGLLYRLIIPGVWILDFQPEYAYNIKVSTSSILFISLFSTTTQNAESHSHLYSIKDTVVSIVDTEITHEYVDHTH